MPKQYFRSLYLLTFFAFAQAVSAQSKITVADSTRFAKLGIEINNSNVNPKRGDSIARVYYSEAKKLQNEDHIGRAASFICNMQLVLDNMENATKWYKISQYYFKRSGNYLWSGYSSMNMGSALTRKYNFEQGFPYLIKSVKDFEKAKDVNQLIMSYNAISVAFHDFGNYEKGKEYAFLGLKTINESKEDIKPIYKWFVYAALAINYDDNKEWDKAIETHLKSIPFANEYYISSTYNNLGNTYKKKGELQLAEKYLKLSLDGSRKMDESSNYRYASVFGNIADVYKLKKQYSLANQYLDSTLYHSRLSKSPEKLIDAYEYGYQIKSAIGDYKTASIYLKQYVTLKDSLLSAEKAKIIYNYQELYETEKKQKLIEQQQFEISKKNYWLIIALVSILLLFIGAWLVYRNYKLKQDRKLQHEILKQHEIESKALFEGEQHERIRIARDLHDGVGQLLSLVKMKLSMMDASDKTIRDTSDLVDTTISEVRSVSHNLIPEALSFGIFRALEDITDKINSSGTTQMLLEIPDAVKNLTFDKQNELSIYRIVQEVVNNMVKHSGANQISLSISQTNNTLIIAIKDNGRGLDSDSITHSEGIGWKNINARVHLLDGKINIKSEKLSGTQIEITLPGHGK